MAFTVDETINGLIMKRLIEFCLFLLLCCHTVNAADMDLQIQLPDMKMMLPPVSPPQLQKEGMPLVEENEKVKDYFRYIDRGEYEEALAHLRISEGSTLELIENGDPDGQLRQRAVVGGIMPTTRANQISAYLLYLIGHTYFSLEKYQAAETAFLSALGPLPDFIRVHESLGLLYMRMERYKEAQRHLSHAAGLGLHTAQLFGTLGYLNYQIENFWGAASAFQEALMLDPDNEQCKRGLLQSLSMTYQHQSALNLVESMLLEHPDDAGLWLYRGNAALQAGERDVALSSLETAIRLGDDTGSNLQVCAILHMEVGSIKRAVELLKTGFAREKLDFIFIDQAMTWLKQEEEWALLERLVDSVRKDWGSLDQLQRSKVLMREADISIHQGNESAAREALEEAITLDPSNAYALMSLAGIHHNNRNYNRAELLYQRASAYDLYRENALISLAQLALDQENFARALKILRDMLKEFPHRTDLNRNIESLENLVLLQSGN
jgi:tetratricopeptide (TPR) repeat protein